MGRFEIVRTDVPPRSVSPFQWTPPYPYGGCGTEISQVFIGTCIMEARRPQIGRTILDGKQFPQTAGSLSALLLEKYWLMLDEGIILQLVEAGDPSFTRMRTPARARNRRPGDGENVLSTANRNSGEMGTTSQGSTCLSRHVRASALEGGSPIRGRTVAESVRRTDIGKHTGGRAHTFGDNINTDYIIAGKYTKTLDFTSLRKNVFEDIAPGFSKRVRPGDIVAAGRNFGCGSSREQAPIAIKYAGISAILAKSYSRIFFRNAINQGIPCFLCDTDGITQDDTVTVNIGQNFVELAENGKRIPLEPLSPVMLDILREGGLVEYLKKNGKIHPSPVTRRKSERSVVQEEYVRTPAEIFSQRRKEKNGQEGYENENQERYFFRIDHCSSGGSPSICGYCSG
jgi:3-isopropylmalate/(R)-2-methylmalate dehydratase small subunit